MLTKKRVNGILEKTGVLLTGHFQLTSGKHSNKYLQCAKVFQHPDISAEISKDLAEKYDGYDIDIVIGPAVGGIILAYEVARQLEVRALFAERENGIMTLRRGFEIQRGSKVLVVEDVITTGGSVKEVIDVVRSAGGEVVGVAAVVDRSGGKAIFDVPFKSAIKIDIEVFEPGDCPMCKSGSKAVKPGSRNI
ncbi:MAG TPA: orotate phosphoribosyltransferase [Bacillota bacterium]|nr:orotate phosphoribosyltransferase [Bacillota bacterium]HPL99815.1 orotate phosphoribosyltransferase [Bacillota bacterium]HPW40054.1 orotate phosphoribosyltransferase [Bacillota bacterium]